MATMPIQTSFSSVVDENVYGVKIRNYSFDGKSVDHSLALALASLQQSEAIESILPALNAAIENRQRKVSDLAEVLSTITEAIGSMDPKDNDTSKKSGIDSSKLTRANSLLAAYGIKQMSLSDGQVTYKVAYYKQADVQAALDTENNELQQNMIQIQSYVTKRDNAFSVANKVIQKENATARETINAMGY
jgi:hypothetical protein